MEFVVRDHRKQEISPGGIYAVTTDPPIGAAEFFQGPAKYLRDLFNAIASQGDPHLMIINVGREHTNSQQDELHAHVVVGDFAPEYGHINKMTTYVPHPGAPKEAVFHERIVLSLTASTLPEFLENEGKSYDWEALRRKIEKAIKDYPQGVRIFIDRDDVDLIVQMIAGENLAQDGKSRWFEQPQLPDRAP
jgi:hypothetical protein